MTMQRVRTQQPPPVNCSDKDESGVVLRALYKMNWMLIYYVAIILEIIAATVKFIKTRVLTLLSSQLQSNKTVLEVLESHKAELKKHPNHLTVILSRDTVNYEDLSKLIYWAMGLGVQYFSLYDPKGLLKDHRKEFEKYILSHKILPGKVTFLDAVVKQRDRNPNNNNHIEDIDSSEAPSSEQPRQRTTTGTADLYEKPPVAPQSMIPNGFPRAILVQYISEADGKSEIAQLCRTFSESIKRGSLSLAQINIEFVDAQLREQFGQMPDPDLALYTGRFCCTYGFLPWHIRLTEFLQIGQGLVLQDFLAVLYKYAKKEQRYGK